MKILWIHPKFRKYREVLFDLLCDNFDVQFIFIERLNKGEGISRQLKRKMKYHCLNLRASKILNLTLTELLVSFWELSRILLKSRVDLVISSTEYSLHSKIAFFWCKILRKKYLIWIETWYENKNLSLFIKIYHILSKTILRYSDAILVHGSNQKKYCSNLGLLEKKIFIFKHCSSDLLKRNITRNIRTSLHLRNRIIILFLGRLIKIKGLHILIRAFKRIENEFKNSYLLICGKGKDKDFFVDISNQLEIRNIKFYGYVNPCYVQDFFRGADIFVLPSIEDNSQREGWGLVVNEAAGMGLPIITTDAVGAAPDLIRDGWNGYIVSNGNVDELHNALHKMHTSGKLRERMGRNSRKMFENFNDLNSVVENLKKAIDFVKAG